MYSPWYLRYNIISSNIEFVKKNAGKEINGFNNHMWNGITCLQFAIIVNIIIKKGFWWNGVRHIFSPQSHSKYELVCMINDIYDLKAKINKFDTPQPLDKTLKSEYDSCGLFDIPPLQKQIESLSKFSLQ